MALLRYFQPKDGLPDPKGALSASLPTPAIALANREVQKIMIQEKDRNSWIIQEVSLHLLLLSFIQTLQ